MKPFLYQVASLFYKQHGRNINRLAFVFPNRRAGLFFQKYLAEISPEPIFSPTILTINDLFLQLSGKQSADRISMLFALYEIYLKHSQSMETFDEFLYWGEMLLNDFDDIDKYMADARMLFSNVTDLHEIEQDFSFLDEDQIAAIRTFWSSFYPKGDSPNQQQFLSVWHILYDLYRELRESLSAQGQGYEGMIFREVTEQFQQDESLGLPYQQIVFVGLNALSTVEERFLSLLQERGLADFYWDYDSPFVRDPNNKAAWFALRNLKNFPSLHSLDPEEEKQPDAQLSLFDDGNANEEPQAPDIEIIGIPSAIGQAKQVHELLSDVTNESKNTSGESEWLRTAIVLPDEHLLIPVLHAIPEEIRKINVTMGYPLAGTPVSALMEYILALQKNVRYLAGQPQFYFRDVLPVLQHRYVGATAPEVIAELIRNIAENNKIYISHSELSLTPLLSVLFRPVTEVGQFSDYLIGVLEQLNRIMSEQQKTSDDDESIVQPLDLEQEFIFHYFATVNRLKSVIEGAGVEMRMETYFRLLKRITDTITIPFRGEPLSGLQVMGVLETRALDFDRLIILSVNEGVFPLKKAANSFIPYNLRRGFGLPTYEHQDSIWAYHFYRLIYRARKVTLLYDTRANGMQTGEVSRFVHQLRYHYEVPLQDKLVVYNVASSQPPRLSVPKSADIMRRMGVFLKGGSRALSASAINTFLDCPLKFYFSVVEGIEEEQEVSETIESNVFGSILHKVMEELYNPLEGHTVTADLLKAIQKDQTTMTHAIERAFAEVFLKTDVVRSLTGQNFLIGEMIRKYVEKILERDRKLTPFLYIRSEQRVKADITLSDGKTVQLKGFIDRVDQVHDTVRIIDYKSGTGSTRFTDIPTLFDREEKNRSKAVMQVFLYAWMYGSDPEGKAVQPGIYYLRTLFAPTFDPAVYQQIERGKSEAIHKFEYLREPFEESLRSCLDELFDPGVAFTQTTQTKNCAWCLFKTICGK